MNRVSSALRAQVAGRRVLVFGLGLQGGVKVANRLLELGASVRVTDRKTSAELASAIEELSPGIEQSLGQESMADIEWAEILVKNPGVPFDHPLILAAQESGVIVTTETALALQHVRDRTIGVSGTRGKTTTTTLIWHILKQAGKNAVIGGNIPQQPTLESILSADDEAWIVLELSSFQLEATDREHVSPHIAILTSLSPDHLNRYRDMDEYVSTKAALFRWQKNDDIAIWWKQPEEWENIIEQSLVKSVETHALQTAQDFSHLIQSSPLSGTHNQNNIALACQVAKSLGIDDTTVSRALSTFTGVPYRQQIIPTQDGVTWINDTTATTPTALATAIETFREEQYILIMGGTTKHLPFDRALIQEVKKKAPTIVWLSGSGTAELQSQLGDHTTPYDDMAAAVAAARQLAQETGITKVVLSPGFSSFEHFKNEFDRGDQFNAAVQKSAPAVSP